MKKIITVVIALTAACAAATIANAQTATTPAEATTLAAAADTVKTAVADTVMVAAPAEAQVFQATGEKAPAKNTAKADKPANGQDKAAAAKADEKAAKQAAAKAEAQQKAEEKAVKENAKAAEQKPAEKAKAAEQPAEKAAAEKADEKAAKQPAAEKADEKAEKQPATEKAQPEEDLAAQPAEPMTAEELEAKKAEVAAQIEELEEMECESEFEKSTSLAVGLGAQYYMGENNKYWDVADPVFDIVTTKVLDLSVTRQHGPVFSWGADLNAAEYIGLYQKEHPNAKFTTGELILKHPHAGQYYYRQSGWYARADLFAGFNVINIFRGYKEKPVFDLDAKIGAGAIFGVGSEDDQTSLAPQITAGLEAKFNITQRIAIKAAIRGAVVGDKFDGESRADEPDEVHKKANVPVDGIFGATVGVSFRLGKSSSIKEAKKAAEERDAQLEQLRAYHQLLEEAEVAE